MFSTWTLWHTATASYAVFAIFMTVVLPQNLAMGSRLRIASIFHAIVTTIIAGYYVIELGPYLWNVDRALWTRELPMAKHTLALSMGYMANDLLLGLVNPGLMEWPMVAHHLSVIGLFGSALATNFVIQPQVLFLINEASTPFVNINYLMRAHGWEPKWAVTTNGLAMWFTFLVFRMIFNPYLVGVSIVTSVGSMPLLLSVVWWVNFSLIFILQALNVFWFYKMTMIILRKAGILAKAKEAPRVSGAAVTSADTAEAPVTGAPCADHANVEHRRGDDRRDTVHKLK